MNTHDPNKRVSSDEIDVEIDKGLVDIRAKRFSEFTPENAKKMAARFKAQHQTTE